MTICKSTKIIRKGAAEREQIRRERFAEFWAWVEYTERLETNPKALAFALQEPSCLSSLSRAKFSCDPHIAGYQIYK